MKNVNKREMSARSLTDHGSNSNMITYFAWSLSILVSAIAFVAWGHNLGWNARAITYLSFFPLLGMLAFSIMWSHYISNTLRKLMNIDQAALIYYFKITGYVVLASIIFHPGLLVYGLFRQGFGLPPGSYVNHYIAPGAAWATMLGFVSLLIFLSFELRRKYNTASWWKYVSNAQDFAMLGILVHSLKLGSTLQTGWLRMVWYFYGITLIAALIYKYRENYFVSKSI